MLKKIKLNLAIAERSCTSGLLTLVHSLSFALAGHAEELSYRIRDLDADIYKDYTRTKLVRVRPVINQEVK